MVVRAGNGCLAAATALGWTHIAAVVVDEGSTDATGYEIMDNRSAEKGSDWDFEMLGQQLSALKEEDFDLDMVGFSDDEFGELLDELTPEGEVEEDEAPEAVDDPVVKTGDLWLLGDHRLLCGDCTKVEDVERVMCGEKADMVFTDPPYGMNLDTDYSKMPRGKNTYKPVHGDNKDFDPKIIFQNFGNAKRFCVWGADWFYNFMPVGFSPIVWDKQPYTCEAGPQGHFELCWVKPKEKRRIIRHLWTGYTAKERKEKRVHPTQKPIAVCVDIISNSENNLVVDPFLGSGTTLIAAEQLNRRCYGLEISPPYCQVILERYRNLTNEEPILEATGKPFSDILPRIDSGKT